MLGGGFCSPQESAWICHPCLSWIAPDACASIQPSWWDGTDPLESQVLTHAFSECAGPLSLSRCWPAKERVCIRYLETICGCAHFVFISSWGQRVEFESACLQTWDQGGAEQASSAQWIYYLCDSVWIPQCDTNLWRSHPLLRKLDNVVLNLQSMFWSAKRWAWHFAVHNSQLWAGGSAPDKSLDFFYWWVWPNLNNHEKEASKLETVD